ncbi:MAG TPA: hypothetical protein VGN36_03960, partial [Sphingorhabdus sp.]|nr:hypothetical protein [Sphingorhabdus sp.]
MTFSTSLLLAATALPAFAQDNGDGTTPAATETAVDARATDIVVTAERIKGAVDTDIPPVEELNEADIAAVGAASLTDLVAAVAPQTNSG